MPIVLEGFEGLTQQAVRHYWRTLEGQSAKQRTGDADRGGRAAVTGGKQMMGFCHLVQNVLAKNGVPKARLIALQKQDPKKRFGGWEGKVWIAEDFDAPLPAELLDAFEGKS